MLTEIQKNVNKYFNIKKLVNKYFKYYKICFKNMSKNQT